MSNSDTYPPLSIKDIIEKINSIEADVIYVSESKNMLEIRRICEDIICSLAYVKSQVLSMSNLIRTLVHNMMRGED